MSLGHNLYGRRGQNLLSGFQWCVNVALGLGVAVGVGVGVGVAPGSCAYQAVRSEYKWAALEGTINPNRTLPRVQLLWYCLGRARSRCNCLLADLQ